MGEPSAHDLQGAAVDLVAFDGPEPERPARARDRAGLLEGPRQARPDRARVGAEVRHLSTSLLQCEGASPSAGGAARAAGSDCMFRVHVVRSPPVVGSRAAHLANLLDSGLRCSGPQTPHLAVCSTSSCTGFLLTSVLCQVCPAEGLCSLMFFALASILSTSRMH